MFFAKNEFDPSTASPTPRIARLGRNRRVVARGYAALGLLGAAGLGWWMFGGSHQPVAAMPVAEVAVAYPLQRNIVEYDELTGRFETIDDMGQLVLVEPEGNRYAIAVGDVVKLRWSGQVPPI